MTATVIVETRHLDTDRRAREDYEVEEAGTDQQRRSRLIELVGRLYPAATHRSYADGAATFLDRDHLIVAFYERRTAAAANGRRGTPASRGSGQDSLFES